MQQYPPHSAVGLEFLVHKLFFMVLSKSHQIKLFKIKMFILSFQDNGGDRQMRQFPPPPVGLSNSFYNAIFCNGFA
jgi:hypothetical protein